MGTQVILQSLWRRALCGHAGYPAVSVTKTEVGGGRVAIAAVPLTRDSDGCHSVIRVQEHCKPLQFVSCNNI